MLSFKLFKINSTNSIEFKKYIYKFALNNEIL